MEARDADLRQTSDSDVVRLAGGYRDQVLPPSVHGRVSIEAATTFGWERWVGPEGRSIGLDRFDASAPAEVLFERFGFTADAVVEAARGLL